MRCVVPSTAAPCSDFHAPLTACSDAPRSHAVPEVRQSTAPQFFDWHAFIKFLSPPEFVRSLAEAKKHVRAGSDTPEVASKRPRS